VPTRVGPDKPPKYPTTYYTDFRVWYQKRTYNVFGTETKDAANDAVPLPMVKSQDSF
jgi:hypothetical protein